ncbi:MAG: DUF4260 domain-containing protein [Terracidiphilus sp.]|jgi:hypothetical protein
MATVSALPEPTAATPARSSSVIFLLRLEGLAAATAAAVLYAHTGASWWLFAALWLAPDLSMLGYFAGACRGARIYNAFHTYVAPGVLALCSLLPGAHGALPLALIWANHIGVDRLLGYGLKYADGFGFTHLGRVGKQRA